MKMTMNGGGAWTNLEDEILKAAVTKYGFNQWPRVSSMIKGKSATQCKARWNEFLEPSIKKIVWSPAEDEKLLHLAKIMPSQWRTIAPMVGRTASQCIQRYETLLDAACGNNERSRKFHPGEIDPNLDSKPARPDPVDMEDYEKEMLSEVRARLANTKGKKAQRKERGKQIEEAKKLALLQKRRELNAAGIDPSQRKRKGREIDYGSGIPFEKRPPSGFFDVADKYQQTDQRVKFPITIEELEGEKRADREARLRKQDVARNRIAERQGATSYKLNANEMVRKKTKLNLPAPRIPNHELEEIAKIVVGYGV